MTGTVSADPQGLYRAAVLRANARAFGPAPGSAERWHVLVGATGPRLTVGRIKQVVARCYDLTPADLEGPRVARRYSWPRQVAMYLARVMADRSQPDIGARFGGRDHSTVGWALQVVPERMAADPDVRDEVEAVRAAVIAGGCS